MEKNIDYEICRQCGGMCCRECGCVYLPCDFKSMSFKNLTKVLDKGYVSISGEVFNGFYKNYWSFMPYLRARNKGAGVVDLISKGGVCMNLSDNGCKLKEDKRPSVGLMLKPTLGGVNCRCSDTTKYIYEWLNYCGVLEKLVKYYSNKDLIDIVSTEILEEMKRIDKKIEANGKLESKEEVNLYWYHNIMSGNPYFPIEDVKRIVLSK